MLLARGPGRVSTSPSTGRPWPLLLRERCSSSCRSLRSRRGALAPIPAKIAWVRVAAMSWVTHAFRPSRARRVLQFQRRLLGYGLLRCRGLHMLSDQAGRSAVYEELHAQCIAALHPASVGHGESATGRRLNHELSLLLLGVHRGHRFDETQRRIADSEATVFKEDQHLRMPTV